MPLAMRRRSVLWWTPAISAHSSNVNILSDMALSHGDGARLAPVCFFYGYLLGLSTAVVAEITKNPPLARAGANTNRCFSRHGDEFPRAPIRWGDPERPV
jgi:hypothetical protein